VRPALRVLVVLACALMGGLMAVPQARAQRRDPAAVAKAKRHFEQGQRLFTVSRYREALEEFKEAFVAVQDPVFLFNIAQSHRLLGERGEALRFYRRFLESRPAPPAQERARAQKWIAELEAEETRGPAQPTSPILPPPAGGASPAVPPAMSSPLPAAEPALEGTTGNVAPASATAPPVDVQETHVPLHKRWWLWAGVGAAVVAGGIATAVMLGGGGGTTCGRGVDHCTSL
jgi:hypothetical protein